MTQPLPHSKAFIYYLLLTAVLCGGLIMVIEVLGSRVIGPFFGVSLFVWTSIIAVTLITLALGYAIGGLLADRYPSPSVMYGIILMSALFVLLIPWLKQPILELSFPLGLRMGTFVSAALLLGPSLFLLGCVSPYLIKIVSHEITHLGKTVGGFYALSTLGSVIGTVLTGFVLIAYFHTNQIYHIVGVLLLLLSIGYFVFFHRRPSILLLAVIPFFSANHEPPLTTMIMDNGTRVTRVAEKESHYGSLKVLDYEGGGIHTREMIIDGLVQGGIDMADKRSIYGYAYFLQYLPRALHPTGSNALMIGLGAGIIPSWYQQQGVAIETIEINPDVADIAQGYFGFQGEVHIADARYFLNASNTQYDYLLLDVFSGDDATAMELMLLGGKGNISVTANVAPKAMHELCSAALAADRDRATQINDRLDILHSSLFVESNPIPVKWALYEMGLIPAGIRLPLTPLAEEYRETVRHALRQAGVLDNQE